MEGEEKELGGRISIKEKVYLGRRVEVKYFYGRSRG